MTPLYEKYYIPNKKLNQKYEGHLKEVREEIMENILSLNIPYIKDFIDFMCSKGHYLYNSKKLLETAVKINNEELNKLIYNLSYILGHSVIFDYIINIKILI